MGLNPFAAVPHNGLHDWLVQRISAAIIVLSVVIVFIALLVQAPQGFEAWRGFVMQGWFRLLLALNILAIVWHAYIGTCDILIDYIKYDTLRRMKVIGLMAYLLVCLFMAISIII